MRIVEYPVVIALLVEFPELIVLVLTTVDNHTVAVVVLCQAIRRMHNISDIIVTGYSIALPQLPQLVGVDLILVREHVSIISGALSNPRHGVLLVDDEVAVHVYDIARRGCSHLDICFSSSNITRSTDMTEQA